jgi:EmrB/QacA subfamily drug resistance transporter
MKRPIVVASITLGMLLAALDQMIMSTAMPEVQKVLGGAELYSWVFSAYMLASTITVPIFGKLADRYGRKKIYLMALFIFLVGSTLCALSNTMWQLVLSRIVQGLGAGGVLPLTITIAGDLFEVKDRGKIQGLFSSMWAIAGISGPVLGGFLIENVHWSWIFWLNIPIGLIAMIGFLSFQEQGQGEKNRIDYFGALLLSSAIGTLLFATLAKQWWEMLGLVLISALLSTWFVQNQNSKEYPLIRIQMLKDPMILWLNVSGMIITMGLFVVPMFIPLYAQDVLGYSPLASGLILMGQVVGWNVTSVPAGKFILRYGYKKAIVIGISLLIFAGILLVAFMKMFGYIFLIVNMFIMGLGFGLAFTSLTIGVQEAVAWKERGISTSIQMFSRNLGTTIGVTIVGAVLNVSRDNMSLAMSFQIVFIVSILITIVGLLTSLKVPVRIQSKEN